MRLLKSMLSLALLASAACAQASSPLDSLGLKPGAPYPRVRAELLKQGWTFDAQEPEEASDYREAPEVACGHGRDAVCTVRYLRDGRTIVLTLKPVGGQLQLQGAEADE